MTKLLQRVDVTLRSFYMFNSSFSKKEGDEHKKILYYHPADIELNTKIKDVGLSEAIIRFTGTFTAEEGCKALHTLKTTQLFYQPEPDYWMVLVLNVPKEIRIKDGVDVTDYRGGEVQDRIYSAILEQCYKSYRLFHGTFEMNRSESEIEEEAEDERRRAKLRERLKLFFDKLIPSLKFPVCQFNDVTRSIQYLPLDKSLFLRAHNLMSMVRATFPFIEETVLLNDEQVVCSGNIDPYDLYSLHEFIVQAKDTPQNSAQSNNSSSSSNSNDETSTGCFVQINENSKKSLTVYLRIGKKPLQAYQLIVYRATSATMCLLVNDTEQLNVDFYAELQSYIGPQLSGLARDIAAVVQQAASNSNKKSQLPSPTSLIAPGSGAVIIDENSPKYLFVNEQSLKHLSNIPIDKRRSKIATIQNSLPTNVLNLIVDLSNFGLNDSDDSDASAEEQCKTIAPEFEEVQIKTTTDFWIVKRRCNWRQYFVIIFNNKATLLDVTQEAKRIFEQELTDAVFFDK